ncbi:fatty acyl-AMP ligase [Micromonospora sp. NPDC006431]|uniref:fatty acyl-AMP ligase n=1 Tax=Micromonospora sp. NPDC006431 TaxID=3364235 RepID=UPI0036BAC9A9
MTLAHVLNDKAERHPEREALAFIPDINEGKIADRLTFGQLAERSRRLAARLATAGFEPGARALLLFPSGLDFAVAFFACSYARLIAVPAPLPERSPTSIQRLAGMVADAEPALILTVEESRETVREWAAGNGYRALPCITVADTADPSPDDVPLELPTPDDLALLQYTSGSTSDPKGVMVSQGNLLSNLDLIDSFVGRKPAMRVCGWLPHIHDMGLIGQLLYPVYVGGWLLQLPPLEFLKRPSRWLELIARHRIQCAAAPNFAYDLCARVTSEDQAAELDLSHWEIALNGAEPINDRTLERFATRFAPAGFRMESFLPCYGLAEATLIVTGRPAGQPVGKATVDPEQLAHGRLAPMTGAGGKILISSGTILHDNVLIVDPGSRMPLADGRVGEIWVTGASVSRGYWRKDEVNEEIFGATTTDGRGPYLRTGDLGVRDGAELYVTGRIKDLIISNGRNLHPHDLECALQEMAGDLPFGSSAVFAIEDHQVVAVQEIRGRQHDDLAQAAARLGLGLAQQFGIGRTSVVFVRPGAVRKTTSGKTRRSAMRQLFLESGLDPIYVSLAPGMSERLGKTPS